MELIFKPFCSQISRIKFISDVSDPVQLFLVGSSIERNNTLTLMQYGIASDICDEPATLSRVHHKGDVMDIKYNPFHRRILTCGSSGSLSFYKIIEDKQMSMELDVGWDGICEAPISSCIFSDERIVIVSEVGEVFGMRLDASASQTSQGFEFRLKDCSAIRAIEVMDNNSFVTVNSLGQVKCWDVRTSTKNPTWVNQRSGEMTPIHCLAKHPGQPNIIASGSTGNVYIWDTRCTEFGAPIQLYTGIENNDIWQMKFHPTSPNHLFFAASCSGLVDIVGKDVGFNWGNSNEDFANLDMRSIVGSNNVNMTCLDVCESLVVSATDKEMLCLIPLASL